MKVQFDSENEFGASMANDAEHKEHMEKTPP